MFLYNVAFDTVNIILFAHIVSFFDRKYKNKKSGAANNKAFINELENDKQT